MDEKNKMKTEEQSLILSRTHAVSIEFNSTLSLGIVKTKKLI